MESILSRISRNDPELTTLHPSLLRPSIHVERTMLDALINALTNNRSLKQINLGSLRLRYTSLGILRVLKTTKIETLDLCFCDISYETSSSFGYVGQIITLKCLNLKNINIQIKNFTESLNNMLTNLTNLEELIFDENNLSEESSLELLYKSLTNLRRLNLGNTHLGVADAATVSSIIRDSLRLEYLNLSGNRLTVAGFKTIGSALASNTVLKELNLDNSAIGAGSMEHLAHALRTNSTLEVLDLSGNSIRSKIIITMSIALAKNIGLRKLELAWNEIGNDGIKSLCKAVEQNLTLKILNLGHNSYSSSAGLILGKMLATNIGLEEFYIDTPLGDEGTIALFEGVRLNPNLRVLEIGKNELSSVGIQAVASVLATKKNLETFEMRDEVFRDPYSMSRILGEDSGLINLNLTSCKFDKATIDRLGAVLAINEVKLENLNLSKSKVDGDELKGFFNGLQNNTTLKSLCLCGISRTNPETCSSLISMIRYNTTLEYLDIDYVDVEIGTAENIVMALEFNPTLTTLKLELATYRDDIKKRISEYLERNQSNQIKKKNSLFSNVMSRFDVNDLSGVNLW